LKANSGSGIIASYDPLTEQCLQKSFKKSAWELQEGDAVPEQILLADPSLDRIEHNPVFRLLILHRHTRKWWSIGEPGSLITLESILQAAVYLTMAFTYGHPEIFWIILGLPYAKAMVRRFSSPHDNSRTLLGIPNSIWSELHQAGVAPETIAAGILGFYSTQRVLRHRIWKGIGYLLLGILILTLGYRAVSMRMLPLLIGVMMLDMSGFCFGWGGSRPGFDECYMYFFQNFRSEFKNRALPYSGGSFGHEHVWLIILTVLVQIGALAAFLYVPYPWVHSSWVLVLLVTVFFCISVAGSRRLSFRMSSQLRTGAPGGSAVPWLSDGLSTVLHDITKHYTENPYKNRRF